MTARYQYTTYGHEPGTYEDHQVDLDGPFYHGSRSRALRAGSLITAGRRRNGWGDEDPRKTSHVYLTGDLETARAYADAARGAVYEVEPTGVITPDGSGGNEAYKTADPLRVVRRIGGVSW